MNQYVPDWNMENNYNFKFPFSSITQKKPSSSNSDFGELLWQNGHVVVNSQGNRKIPAITSEFRQAQKEKPSQQYEQSLGNSSELIQDDGAASWFQCPLEDTLDKEFCSEFFSEMAGNDAAGLDKLSRDAVSGQARHVKFGQANNRNVAAITNPRQSITGHENLMPSWPQFSGSSQPASREESGGLLKFTNLSKQPTKDGISTSNAQVVKQGPSTGADKSGRESSVMTVGSSVCGSNQIPHQIDPSSDLSNNTGKPALGRGLESDKTRLPSDKMRNNAYETTVTSSSGGSGYSIDGTENQNVTDRNHKRKAIVLEESGSQSEDADYESNEGKKSCHQSKSARRSRAAEVHNLAERRRRDRINEKMKALQDLIPHCNKTDKASMLDEAIEYLKSLQLQVQMMWMGSGMAAPMMFPGVQHYMPGMGMGFGHSSLPSMHTAVQLPRAPFLNQTGAAASTLNQSFLVPPPTFSGVNFPNQMPNIQLPDTYGHLFNFHQMQPQSQTMQQNQFASSPSTSILPNVGGAPCQSFSNNKSGQ